MAWCPQCKEEYEDHVVKCADCDIPLVASLNDISTDRMLLVLNSYSEAERVLEFLNYSGTQSARIDSTKDDDAKGQDEVYTIYVDEKEWEASMKYMQGFMAAEREEPDEEDYYFNDYEMLVIDGEADMAELRSSYISLLAIGGIVAIVGLLHVVGVLDFLASMLSYVMVVLGLAFFGGGFLTLKKSKEKAVMYEERKARYDAIVSWYHREKGLTSLTDRYGVVVQEIDPGAEYFVYMDMLVKDLKDYPEQTEEAMINTVADSLYHQLREEPSAQ